MYFRTLKKYSGDVSINEVLDSDKEGNHLVLSDILGCEDEVFDIVDQKMKVEKLYNLLQSELDDRELEIICLRYGIGKTRDMTQREVAQRLGLSRSYISRIEKKVLGKLSDAFGAPFNL